MRTTMPLLWLSCLAGNGTIYLGQAFIGGRLLPTLLDGTYAAVGRRWHLVAMTATTVASVNYLFSRAYVIASPATTGMAAMGSLVMVLLANATLVGCAVTPRALLAAGATLGSSMWLASELG